MGVKKIKTRNAFFKSDFQTREEGEKKYIDGYFIVYGQKTKLWAKVYEEISIGACRESIKENDIRALFNHNSDLVLGRKNANTLTLSEDTHGIKGVIEINESDKEALNVYERVKRKDIVGCSFGFYPEEEEYFTDETTGETTVFIKKANVIEISVCAFPAYPQTEIIARQNSMQEMKKDTLNRSTKILKERYKNVFKNS